MSKKYTSDKIITVDIDSTNLGTFQDLTVLGTFNSDIIISKESPILNLNDTNTTTGTYPRIDFNTNNNQGVSIEHNELDGELPTGGYGLIIKGSPNNNQFPTTGTLSLSVLGNIYAGGTTTGTLNEVYHSGNFSKTQIDALNIKANKIKISSNDNFTGTYPVIWGAGNEDLWEANWLNVNGATDTLNTVNLSTSGNIEVGGTLTSIGRIKPNSSVFSGEGSSGNSSGPTSLGSDKGYQYTHVGGGTYSTSMSSVTGAIKISVPGGFTDRMLSFTVKIYDYATNESFSIDIAGYPYNSGSWLNCTATITANNKNRDFTVRWGNDVGTPVVYIGELASSWSYPNIHIVNAQAGFNSSISHILDEGWNIDFESTSFATISRTQSSNLPATDWSKINDIPTSITDIDSRFLRSDVTDTMLGVLNMSNDLFILNGKALRFYRGGGDAYQRADARLDDTDKARLHWYGRTDGSVNTNFRHAWYDGASYIDVTANTGGRIDFTGSASSMYIGVNKVATENWSDGKFLLNTTDTLTGDLTVTGIGEFSGAVRITETGTAQHLLMGNQDSLGVNKPSMIRAANGILTFGVGNSWVGEGGTMTEYFRISDGGNIGVNITNPGTRLHIVENGGSAQLTLERTGGGAGKAVLAGASEGLIVYDDLYGPKMYVGTSGIYNGKVGIGTTTPGGILDIVYTGTGGSGTFGIGEGLNIHSFSPNITFNDTSTSIDSYAIHLNQNVFTLGRYTSSTSQNYDLVLKDGKVGVGKSDPTEALDVVGNLSVTGKGYFGNSTVDVATLTVEGNLAGILDVWRSGSNASFGAIRFRNSTNTGNNAIIGYNTNELRLESSKITAIGNLDVSGTGSFGGSPNTRDFNVSGVIGLFNASTEKGYINTSATGVDLRLFGDNNNEVRLDARSGTVYATENITATNFIGNGSQLTNVDADTLDGFNSTQFLRDDTQYVEITVDGDADTYYPVGLDGSGEFKFGTYSISRRYNWTAPDTWNTSTHRGGLTFTFRWSGDSAWGGNDKTIRVEQFQESYTTMVAGMTLATSGGPLIVWLRGGGARYRIATPSGTSQSPETHLSGFTDTNSTVYPVRTDVSNVSSEIHSRFPVRNSSTIYDNGDRVVKATNTVELTGDVTGSGSFNSSGDISFSTAINGANHTHDNYLLNSGIETFSGNLKFNATAVSGNYATTAIELKEVNNVTTSQTGHDYAPALSFHWGGRMQGKLWMNNIDGLNTLTYSSGAGSGSYPTTSMSIKTGTFVADENVIIKGAATSTDSLLKLYNTTNGSGSGIEFSDNAITQGQKGFLNFYHGDTVIGGTNYGVHWKFTTNQDNLAIHIPSNGGYYVGEDKVFHEGNLTKSVINALNIDADTLDGYHYNELPLLSVFDGSKRTGVIPTPNRNTNPNPNEYERSLSGEFKSATSMSFGSGSWMGLLTFASYLGANVSGAGKQLQIGYDANSVADVVKIRTGYDTTWESWKTLYHSGNLTNVSQLNNDAGYLTSETDSQTLSWNGDTGQLSISNGNTVDLDGRYDMMGGYSYTNGFLIKTDIAENFDTMFSVKILGNGYGAEPYDITLQGYNYNTSNAIISSRGHSTGTNPTIKFFIYQGYLHIWFAQTSAYQSPKIYVYRGMWSVGANHVDTVSNTVMPTTGVTREVTVPIQRVFKDNYHPNADKWTTARTLTLSGEASGSVSIDGSGNVTLNTVLSNDALNDQYVQIGSRLIGNADTLTETSYRLWDVSTSSDKPTGAADGLLLHGQWDSANWATQQYHDFHTNNLYLRVKTNTVWSPWNRVFHDDYHPNADKWTTARTLTLGGDLSGSVSIDGSSNVTLSATVANDSHSHSDYLLNTTDVFTGTLDLNGSLDVSGEIRNGGYNTIDLNDHSGRTWFRNDDYGWTFQGGVSSDDWTETFTLYLNATTTLNAVWAELGQRDSNDVSGGRYRGVRIVKDTGSVVDGDLRAGSYYVGATRKDLNWDTAFGWGDWSTGVDKTFVDGLNIDADTLDGHHAYDFAPVTSNVTDIKAITGDTSFRNYGFFQSAQDPINFNHAATWVSGIYFSSANNSVYRKVLASGGDNDLYYANEGAGNWSDWFKLLHTGNFEAGTDYVTPTQLDAIGLATKNPTHLNDLNDDLDGGLYSITTTTLNQPTNLSADRGAVLNMRRSGSPNTFQLVIDHYSQAFVRGGDTDTDSYTNGWVQLASQDWVNTQGFLTSETDTLQGVTANGNETDKGIAVTSGKLVAGTTYVGAISKYELRHGDSTGFVASDNEGQRDLGNTLLLFNPDLTTDSFNQILFRNRSSSVANARIAAITKGLNSVDLAFTTEDNNIAAERLYIKGSGEIGVGTITPSAKLDIYDSKTKDDIYTTSVNVLHTGGVDANNRVIQAGKFEQILSGSHNTKGTGVLGVASKQGNYGSIATGVHGLATLVGAVTVNNSDMIYRGVVGEIHMDGTNSVNLDDIAYSLYANATIETGAHLKSYYGLFLNAPTNNGTIVNKYGIYQEDGSSSNYFNGDVGIGTNNPDSPLHLYKDNIADGANTLLKLEGYTPDFALNPKKIGIEFIATDTNNTGAGDGLGARALIEMGVVNDVDYGDNDEAAGNLIFSTTDNGILTEKVIITSTGRLGVATLNPSESVEVNGNVKATKFIGLGTDITGTASGLTSGRVSVNEHTTNDIEYEMVWHNNADQLYGSNDGTKYNPAQKRVTTGSVKSSDDGGTTGCEMKYNSTSKTMDFIFS